MHIPNDIQQLEELIDDHVKELVEIAEWDTTLKLVTVLTKDCDCDECKLLVARVAKHTELTQGETNRHA